MKLIEIKAYRKTRRWLRRVLGIDQAMRNARADAAMAVPFSYPIEDKPPSARPVAVVCHIYHDDLSGEILSFLKNLGRPADIYISTDTHEKKRVISEIFDEWSLGLCHVKIVENRGRDIAPKLVEFRDVYQNHDFVLFFHSKRSPHVHSHAGFGDGWRRFLYGNLAGSEQVVASIFEIFDRHPKVGIVMAQHWEALRKWIIWKDTFALSRELGERLQIRIRRTRAIDFPSGSMFWARSTALRPLLDLQLNGLDFAGEEGQIGGTLAHAIERLFLFSCEKSGYEWVKIIVPSLQKERSPVVEIRSPQEIGEFIDQYRFSLLRLHGNLRKPAAG